MNKYGLEARANWIAARIDELMDDADWLTDARAEWRENGFGFEENYIKAKAASKAEREHASLMADLEEAIIDSMELK